MLIKIGRFSVLCSPNYLAQKLQNSWEKGTKFGLKEIGPWGKFDKQILEY